jgi:hypothetical protein
MARVVIELEFDAGNGRKVLNCDVYDYLQELNKTLYLHLTTSLLTTKCTMVTKLMVC